MITKFIICQLLSILKNQEINYSEANGTRKLALNFLNNFHFRFTGVKILLWLGTCTRIYEEKGNLPTGGNLLQDQKINNTEINIKVKEFKN